MNEPLTAYVLHSRPYRETSALVDLFTPQGRLRGVWRGARRKNGALTRPFLPLEVELKGRGELKTITRLESIGLPLSLPGDALYSGFYLNELLVRLLALDDAHPLVYQNYVQTLVRLAEGHPVEPLLRTFEWYLLDQLGYGFSLEMDCHGAPIDPQHGYRFIADEGLMAVSTDERDIFIGIHLLSMASGDWSSPATRQAAKRLMRQALAPHLGERPLISRSFFRKSTRSTEGE